MRLLLAMKKFICRVASSSRKIVPSHILLPRVPKLLAILKTLCETYPGKVVSGELFLPPGDFMQVDTPMWWYNDGSLLAGQRRHALSRDDAESIQPSRSYLPDVRLEDRQKEQAT